MSYRTEEIKQSLLKGGVVLTKERKVGKTTAILQAANELGPRDVGILSNENSVMHLRKTFQQMFPSAPIPSIAQDLTFLVGRSILLIDELTNWTPQHRETILVQAVKYRHWAATGTLDFRFTVI